MNGLQSNMEEKNVLTKILKKKHIIPHLKKGALNKND